MKQMKLFVVVALALSICLPGMAGADIVPIGPPEITHSWAQGFTFIAKTPGTTAMELFMVSGTTQFESPSFTGLGSAGWVNIATSNPNYALATGPAETGAMALTVNFTGTPADTFAFDLFRWTNGILSGTPQSASLVAWANGGWTITAMGARDITGQSYDRSAVPLPPSALLLGSGLLGLVGLGWRRRQTS